MRSIRILREHHPVSWWLVVGGWWLAVGGWWLVVVHFYVLPQKRGGAGSFVKQNAQRPSVSAVRHGKTLLRESPQRRQQIQLRPPHCMLRDHRG
jgi:hypothetical protein